MGSTDKTRYQHVVVSGLPFVRGQSHGEQLKSKILRSLEYYRTSGALPPWDECLEFVKNHYLNATKKYFQSGYEEMSGIADGAGVTLEEIMILNARYDLSRWQRWRKMQAKLSKSSEDESEDEDEFMDCTGTACLSKATKNGDVIIGQNWDMGAYIMDQDTAVLLEIHPDPSENIPDMLMVTEAGQLGRNGMNTWGLGVLGMSLWSSDDRFEGTSADEGWVPVSLFRRMFLQSPTYPKGLRTVLTAPRHVSVNMIIATSEGDAMDLELTPSYYFVLRTDIEKDFLTHANHFKSPSFVCRADIKEGSRGSSSLFRDRRLEKGLLQSWQRIDVDTVINALKDHLGFPDSLCEHRVTDEDQKYTKINPNDSTVACIVYNLTKKSMKLCKGPPCQGVFVEYSL